MSTILVKVTKSVKSVSSPQIPIINAASRAWKISAKKAPHIDTVIAVCGGKIAEVFSANPKLTRKIQTGSNAGRYEFDLTSMGRAGMAKFSSIPSNYLNCRTAVRYYP